MNAMELCAEATRRGLRLEPRGDKLAVVPADRLAPDFAATLRAHKAELLDWLSRPGWQSVPPDNLPLNLVTPRPIAHERERMIAYLLRQCGDRPGPLDAWLVRRECAYFDSVGRHWDCALHAYVAARDAACWQFNRSEREVLELLSGFDECSRGLTPP